ncbi:MAG: hypothetical protein JRI72_00075 [Deltaproteobacteria bacterium]|nr:hypothetical protein [Deltaproteobacteria bacterium]
MALQKDKEMSSGFIATYHNIGVIAYDYKRNNAEVQMLQYKDESARRANKQHVGVMPFQFENVEIDHTKDLRAQFYELVKQKDEFKDSLDC